MAQQTKKNSFETEQKVNETLKKGKSTREDLTDVLKLVYFTE